jgi:alkylated DNA nucleotide flippase Atl1
MVDKTMIEIKTKFEYIIPVGNIKEYEHIAKKLGISPHRRMYANNVENIAGLRLPTERQLFVNRELLPIGKVVTYMQDDLEEKFDSENKIEVWAKK